MFAFLLVVHAIIAAALVTVILMQRSEGGGLGMGGSPSGLMSARGAADFLSRAAPTAAPTDATGNASVPLAN
jgi:preprotein translocase subunit SecG